MMLFDLYVCSAATLPVTCPVCSLYHDYLGLVIFLILRVDCIMSTIKLNPQLLL